jgi:hypothetical protein
MTCIDATQLLALNVANVWEIVGVLFVGLAFNVLGCVSDKQFSTGRGYILTTIAFVDLKLLNVIVEPHDIAPGALKRVRQFRSHGPVLDDKWLTHTNDDT